MKFLIKIKLSKIKGTIIKEWDKEETKTNFLHGNSSSTMLFYRVWHFGSLSYIKKLYHGTTNGRQLAINFVQ
jgi:hypothetical protein